MASGSVSSLSTAEVHMDSSDEEHETSPQKKTRGRGRPKGRRRGHRRGISGRGSQVRRGRERPREPNRADIATLNIQERQTLLESQIDKLSEDQAKDLLKKTAIKYPSLVFDLLDIVPPSGQGYHPSSSGTQPSWCVCSHCREMPTDIEKHCCNKRPDLCISQLPDFSVLILDEAVLALARLYRQEVLVLPDDDNWTNANRHSAYRQFVLWHHGRLGEGIRRVIPSCCVWRIRDKFPDPFGQYTGFIPSRYN